MRPNHLSTAAREAISAWALIQKIPGDPVLFGRAVASHANRAWRELAVSVTREEAWFISRVLTAMAECLEMAAQSATCRSLEALAIHLCFRNMLRRTGGRPWLMEVLTREGDVPVEETEAFDEFRFELKNFRRMDRERRKAQEKARLDFIRGVDVPRGT